MEYHINPYYENLNRSTFSITVKIKDHKLVLYDGPTIIHTYPIAVGKASTPTPKGTFKIINKAINPGGPFGVRWLGLDAPNGDYGIHGTNAPSSIGKNVSNGCIRMYNKDVLQLSSYVKIGTIVHIV
jgi:lipoprotein-anchoring transpeptidase ErfK/SrfK